MDIRRWIAVAGTMLGAFMAILDIQITNASLNNISGGISVTPDEGSWISTSYLIGEIITIPLTAWMMRIFTIRYYLLGNVVLFLIFSCLCGVSTNLEEMIVFRAGQGFTGGVFIPTALTVVITFMPKELQSIGQTMFGITATLAPAVGPYIGGLLTDNIGWEWNFYVNFVPGIIMFVAVYATIPAEKINLKLIREGDWIGIGSMAIGLGGLIAMLEEGQRKDWLGSPFIRDCAYLAGIFVPIFLVREFMAEKPLVKLRLIASRNLGLSTLVAFVLGVALYGTIYLIPQFLGQVQGYSPTQIGETLIWVGLPQLLIFPFLPLLLKRFDIRALVCFGSILFAASCFMNSYMSPDYGKPQFAFANVVRALGQPFTIVPVTALATATLSRQDAGDGSAIFNMFRNLGGSVGIAILDTVATRREQFHDWRIGERVTIFDLAVRGRLQSVQAQFMARGYAPNRAMQQAYDVVKMSVRKNAYTMAYNDAFLIVGYSLVLGAVLVWFCKKPNPKKAASAAH